MKRIMLTCLCFIISVLFFLATSAFSANTNKPQFQYLAYPDTMYINSEGQMEVCLVNQGGSGDLSHDGVSGDHVVISIPVGITDSDLVYTGGVACVSKNLNWVGEVDEVPGVEILLTLRPNGTYTMNEGETICFQVSTIDVNSKVGLAFLSVDQQMGGVAQKPINTSIGIFKTTTTVEIDPTVDPSVKDGVSFTELTDIATDAQIPDDI